MSVELEIEFETDEQAEEFRAAADAMGMGESEYAIWLFETYGKKSNG